MNPATLNHFVTMSKKSPSPLYLLILANLSADKLLEAIEAQRAIVAKAIEAVVLECNEIVFVRDEGDTESAIYITYSDKHGGSKSAEVVKLCIVKEKVIARIINESGVEADLSLESIDAAALISLSKSVALECESKLAA